MTGSAAPLAAVQAVEAHSTVRGAQLPLGGEFHVSNVLAAALLGISM